MNNRRAYYSHFDISILIAAKEILKSMPALYTRVYFSTKYLNALSDGYSDEDFINVTILTELENVPMLRNIIKVNSLYIREWDSLKYSQNEEYGFSFIAGNVKYVLIPFTENPDGYTIRSFDVDTQDFYETNLQNDKKHFLKVVLIGNGDFIRSADFNLEYINSSNTRKFRKDPVDKQNYIMLEDKKGYALTNVYILGLVAIMSIFVVWITAYLFKLMILG